MKKKAACLLFVLLASCPVAFADDLEDIYAQQGLLSFQLLQENVPINGGSMLVSPLSGSFSNGQNKNYPRLRCENGGRTLDSIPIFTGMTLTSRVAGKELELEIALNNVSSPDVEIEAIKVNECRNLTPQQRVVIKQAIKIPYEKSGEAKVISLGNGYAFRYQIFSQPLIQQ